MYSWWFRIWAFIYSMIGTIVFSPYSQVPTRNQPSGVAQRAQDSAHAKKSAFELAAVWRRTGAGLVVGSWVVSNHEWWIHIYLCLFIFINYPCIYIFFSFAYAYIYICRINRQPFMINRGWSIHTDLPPTLTSNTRDLAAIPVCSVGFLVCWEQSDWGGWNNMKHPSLASTLLIAGVQ